MTLAIKHAKVSGIADDSAAVAAGKVVPSDWNADHVITGSFAYGGPTTLDYTFSVSVTNSNPGSGIFRLNNVIENTATALYISINDINAVDLTTLLNSFDASSSTVKANLRLVHKTDATKWLMFDITGKTSHTGYFEFAITNTASSAASPFTNTNEVLVCWERVGDKGTTGTTGPPGSGTAVPGLILGMQPKWTSTTVLGAGSGSVYIESLSDLISGTPVDITPATPANSTWYHIYVHSVGGVPTLEASTSAPVAFATPAGFARSKTGDTSRRYLYSAKTDAGGLFYRFKCDQSGLFRWLGTNPQAAPFRTLSAGTAAVSTVIDCSAVAPIGTETLWIQVQTFPGTVGGNAYISSADYTVSPTVYEMELANPLTDTEIEMYLFVSCSSARYLNYILVDGGSGMQLFVNVFGFMLQR